MNDINLKVFSKKEIVKFYSEESLQKTEEVIFNKIKEEIHDKKILEIGVGGGKTIRCLTQISKNYIGIDYSQDMIDECRKKYPEVDVFYCDARNMSIFKDEEFDFIICAYNGMDYVSHGDRLLILQEVFRVLKNGGYFVFSTHNKNCAKFKLFLSPFSPLFTYSPLKPFTYNLLEVLGRVNRFFKMVINHLRNRRYEIHTDEYSVINDKAHEYSLMTYYITISHQKEQLYNIGFKGPIKAYDRYGEEIIGDSQDTWIYYLVKK